MPKIKSTRSIALHGVKVLVYGASGAGKTTLAGTVEKPLVLATEKGLLTLQNQDIDFIEISSFQELKETVQELQQIIADGGYKTIILDSASELCDLILAEEKGKSKNQLQAYGQMNDLMTQVIRTFVNLQDIDVIFIAKIDKYTNPETGEQKFCAAAPGSKVPQYLPYFFDEVFALRTQSIKTETGVQIQRGLQTADDGIYNCKDRSGRLAFMERADLGLVLNKIKGVEA